MRSAAIFFAGLAAVTHAAVDPAVISQIPECAASSLITGISTSGCSVSDQDCICGNTELLSTLREQVSANCSPEDEAKTLEVTAAICPNLASSAATSAAAAMTSAESTASSMFSVAEAATTAAITTDSDRSPATVASDWPMGTGSSSVVNYTATTGDYTPPATPTVTPSTGGASHSFALGSMVLGIGALGVLFAGF